MRPCAAVVSLSEPQCWCVQTLLDFEQRCGLHLQQPPPTQEGVLVWSGWKKSRSLKHTINPEKQRLGRAHVSLRRAFSKMSTPTMTVCSHGWSVCCWLPAGGVQEFGHSWPTVSTMGHEGKLDCCPGKIIRCWWWLDDDSMFVFESYGAVSMSWISWLCLL